LQLNLSQEAEVFHPAFVVPAVSLQASAVWLADVLAASAQVWLPVAACAAAVGRWLEAAVAPVAALADSVAVADDSPALADSAADDYSAVVPDGWVRGDCSAAQPVVAHLEPAEAQVDSVADDSPALADSAVADSAPDDWAAPKAADHFARAAAPPDDFQALAGSVAAGSAAQSRPAAHLEPTDYLAGSADSQAEDCLADSAALHFRQVAHLPRADCPGGLVDYPA